MKEEITVEITEELDIVRCRKVVRDIAVKSGFGLTDQTRLVTATSELARNIVNYAGEGKMNVTIISDCARKGIELVFEDEGPGFNPEDAINPGYSTSKGLGMGLPGSKRLVDDFELHSVTGKGTKITAIKWLR